MTARRRSGMTRAKTKCKGPAMTNRLAILLGLAVIAAIVADLQLNKGDNLLFLGRKLFVLLDWLAFWR
ncbi:hypothetical protein GCM10011319_17800 [Mameliella alba]|nr:hypothetical protein GCM10011319_17800 [Mameliella alba]